ncbi:MAG: PhzF family phenazine biosynthesis protein [Acidobacteria bacterium]|nr:PhzF family phenazine biosynthesis protein [Acidobacteriota bacterium]
MATIPLYQVDAFTSRLFGGNPAAVCPLEEWLDDATLQAIASENNLAETAFFVERNGRYHLRWLTPEVEVDLCGHATLASAFVILNYLRPGLDEVVFDTQSGELVVRRQGDLLAMDFPARPPVPVASNEDLLRGLKLEPKEVLAARDYCIVYESEEQVRSLAPDMALLAQLDRFAVIVTAPGTDCDFVSRFFAPAQGIAEDPVTGSAHCTLIPYWSRRLGRTELHARQVSRRGGELFCRDRGDRVTIAGHAVLYLKGGISESILSNCR